jgi:Tfp pilus assembly protein PilF
MSLINAMLRDLDARRGPAGDAQLAALQGIGLVDRERTARRSGFAIISLTLVAALLILASAWLSHAELPETGVADLGSLGADSVHWTPLALPQADPRAHAIRRQVFASTSGSAPSPRPPTERKAPAEAPAPVETDNRPEATVVTAEAAPASRPMAASAALETAPEGPKIPIRKLSPAQQAMNHFAQAQRALAKQDRDSAKRLLAQTLQIAPRHLEARTQLASLLVTQQEPDAAEALLAEGLRLDASAGALAKPYAQLLAARDALPEALAALARVSPDADSEALRGAILQRMGNHAEAAGAYETALREQPRQAVWWTGLAIAREHNQQPQQALVAYRRAARLQLSKPVRQYVEQRVHALQNGEDS